jgi:hypothetical protein
MVRHPYAISPLSPPSGTDCFDLCSLAFGTVVCPEEHQDAPKKDGHILVKLTSFRSKPPPTLKVPDGTGLLKNMLDKILLWPADRMQQHYDESK